MERIILIETSTALCSVALAEDGVVTAYRESSAPKAHASLTAVFIQELLSERELTLADCDAVCVSMGPGSYTGLRVGVSTAKGLCFGSGKPLLAVGTLDTLVAQATDVIPSEGEESPGYRFIIPMVDARRMEVYTAVFGPDVIARSEATWQSVDMVLALGGGAVMTAECAEIVHSDTICIYLKASVDTLMEHLSGQTGTLADALNGADIFVGVSAPGIVTEEMVASMNHDAILFAMANPVPEIMPDVAKAAGAKVVGTGRSDFPNQVNNVVAFPGIFKGALEGRATQITEEMKQGLESFVGGYAGEEQTKKSISSYYKEEQYVIDTHTAVAAAVAKAYRGQKDAAQTTKEADTPVKTVIASTASPYKFTRSVMEALGADASADDFALVDELHRLSGVKVPNAIEEIRTAPILHNIVCDAKEMKDTVKKVLKLS